MWQDVTGNAQMRNETGRENEVRAEIEAQRWGHGMEMKREIYTVCMYVWVGVSVSTYYLSKLFIGW